MRHYSGRRIQNASQSTRGPDTRTRPRFGQSRGDKWVELRSPEDETSKHIERAESAQLRKTHSPKDASRKHLGNGDEVLKWADANTAILYAYSDMVVGETPISAHFLFTLKFDAKGNWKIVKIHQMSDEEKDDLH